MKRMLLGVVCAIGLVLMTGTNSMGPPDIPNAAAQEAPAQKASPPDGGAKTGEAGAVPGYASVSRIMAKYYCTLCHGGNEPRAGLSLDDHKSMVKGGRHGPVIVPGNPGSSELIRRLKGTSEPRMPFDGPPWLADDEVTLIEQWIAAGATES